jgi:hypothetical protein
MGGVSETLAHRFSKLFGVTPYGLVVDVDICRFSLRLGGPCLRDDDVSVVEGICREPVHFGSGMLILM